MEDTKKIKVLFAIEVVSVIAETEDDEVGEASTAYEYKLDSSLPELAYSMAGFLKTINDDLDIQKTIEGNEATKVGDAFISLLQSYYKSLE